MATLYIDRKGASLSHDRSRLWIRYAEEKQSILVRHLERVVVSAGCTLDSRTLLMLNEQEIPVVVIDTRKNRATWCGGWHHGNTARRITQYAVVQDTALCAQLAQKLVKLKLMQQRRLLRSLMPLYPARRRALFLGCARLTELITSTNGKALHELRGMEGAGSRNYFAAYRQVFSERFGFTHRNRRPPRDPVNACLSLAYTLLMSDALQALYASGLDPSIGFYHQPAYGRPSLACDLVEIARAQADRTVIGMFREHQLNVGHFTKKNDAVFLDKKGRSLFYACWESNAQGIRRNLNRTASSWASWVSDYSPQLFTGVSPVPTVVLNDAK